MIPRAARTCLAVAALVLCLLPASLWAQPRDPWAWWPNATSAQTMQTHALRAFRTELEGIVPQDFVEPGALDRELLISLVTRGAADLSFDDLRELKTQLDTLRAGQAGPGRLFAEVLRRLGPGFEKLGQFLGNRPDLVREPHRSEIARLSTEGRPMNSYAVEHELERLVRTAQRARGDAAGHVRVIRHFEHRPLGTGSIAQAHAVTFDDGSIVVFKFVKPGVRRALERNFGGMMEVLAAAGHVGLHDMVETLRVKSIRETDLRHEASALLRTAPVLAGREIFVPRPLLELSDENCLTMELAPGSTVGDGGGEGLDPRARAELARRVFNGIVYLVFRGEFHGDPHRGNVMIEARAQELGLSLIDWGLTDTLEVRARASLAALLGGIALRSSRVVQAALRTLGVSLTPAQRELVVRRLAAGEPLLKTTERVLSELQTAGVRLPGTLIAASRALLLAEGVALQLDPGFSAQRSVRSLWRELGRRGRAVAASPILRNMFERQEAVERQEVLTKLRQRVAQLEPWVRPAARDQPLVEPPTGSYDRHVHHKAIELAWHRLRDLGKRSGELAEVYAGLSQHEDLSPTERRAEAQKAARAREVAIWARTLALETLTYADGAQMYISHAYPSNREQARLELGVASTELLEGEPPPELLAARDALRAREHEGLTNARREANERIMEVRRRMETAGSDRTPLSYHFPLPQSSLTEALEQAMAVEERFSGVRLLGDAVRVEERRREYRSALRTERRALRGSWISGGRERLQVVDAKLTALAAGRHVSWPERGLRSLGSAARHLGERLNALDRRAQAFEQRVRSFGQRVRARLPARLR